MVATMTRAIRTLQTAHVDPLDLEAITSALSKGFRVATGESNSPVSTNQSMGYANGQGGNFSKYAIWLDRAGYTRDEAARLTRELALATGSPAIGSADGGVAVFVIK